MMKKLSIIALATTVATAPAYAEIHDTPIASPVANYSETADLAFAFEDVDDLQLTVMTNQEMQETEGAFAPPVVVAYGIRMGVMGTIGAGMNGWNHYSTTGRWS